jgi:Ca-activated chloride channel homolog
MPRPKRLVCAMLTGVSALLLSATPAVADGNSEYAPTMVVLDASGSMAAADPRGGTKMDAAKRATGTFVDSVPEEAPVGLAVYGTNTGTSDAEKAAGCRDVTVLRGPDPVDRAAIKGAVNGLTPRGYTPIGQSLRVAADALPDDGPRSIVLVSDGIDTCSPPDPCEVAKELSSNGVDLIVHTVGFGVDDQARQQLTCIAQTTGGTYTDAPDAGALEDVLPRVTNAALRNYHPAGLPITGTATPADAPTLEPGQYLDTIAVDQRKYYAVDVPANTSVYFTATVAYSRADAGISDPNGFEAQMYAMDGYRCGVRDRAVTTSAADGEVDTVSLIWNENRRGRCAEPGRYLFAVDRDVSSYQPSQLPLEILVGLEPEVTGSPNAEATDEPVPFEAPGGAAERVIGGSSFATAPTLPGSGVYTDTMRLREFVFYRVRVEWGQSVAYRVSYGDTTLDSSANVATRLYSPFRTTVDRETTGYHGEAMSLDPIATPPVNYLNRSDVDGEAVSVAGWYYISVKVGRDLSDDFRNDLGVPVRLEVSVTGSASSGPNYGLAKGSSFGASSSRPAVSAEPETVSMGWVLGGAGAALVLAAAIGTTLVVRRRR